MYYNPSHYPFLSSIRGIEDNVLNEFLVSAELNSKIKEILDADKSGYVDHYVEWWSRDNGFHKDQTGIEIRENEKDVYQFVAIWKKDFSIKHFDAETLFPKTLAAVKSVPNVFFGGIAISPPNAVLGEHAHTRKHLIFHLLLNDLEGGTYDITVNGETRSMSKKGDWLLFDYSFSHSSINNSKTTRYGLVIDFNPFE